MIRADIRRENRRQRSQAFDRLRHQRSAAGREILTLKEKVERRNARITVLEKRLSMRKGDEKIRRENVEPRSRIKALESGKSSSEENLRAMGKSQELMKKEVSNAIEDKEIEKILKEMEDKLKKMAKEKMGPAIRVMLPTSQ